jgi:hemicentin
LFLGLPVKAVLNPTVPPADVINGTCSCQDATVTHLYVMKLNGSRMEELPFKWKVSSSFDVTNQSTVFTAPSHQFLLLIRGRDEHGYRFQRITPTIIPGQAESPVAIPSQTYIVWALKGEPLELLCRYQSMVSVSIVWYKDGQHFNASTRFVFYNDGRLVILNVKDSDAGSYHCEIQSSEGNATGFPFNVSIAESPTILSGPEYVSMAPGQNALFICEVAGVPTPEVEWWINGSVPRYNPRAQINIIQGNGVMAFYQISDVKPEDQGNVTCYAKNIAGETKQTGKFEVQVGPSLTVTPKRLTVQEGEVVNIACKGIGIPVPTVAWLRDSVPLSNVKKVSISETVLSFSSVRLEDRGAYTCIVSNTLGQRKEMAYLEVHATPELVTKFVNISVNETKPVVLKCVVRGNPPPTIVWLHDGQPIKLDNQRQLQNNNQHLVITRVQLEDHGFYMCIAENPIGQDRHSAYLRVITPPFITPIVTPVAVPVGKCISMPCETQGVPPPVSTWYKNSVQLSTRLPKYEIYANGTLQICNVMESDADTYTCIAINEGGKTSASAILDVQVSPRISPLSDQWVMVGKEAIFQCQVTKGNPRAEIQWLNDQSKVLSNSGAIFISRDKTILEIRRVKSRHEGAYTCIASNAAGSDRSTANLNVIVPPTVRSQMTHITVMTGQTVSLNCFASGYPQPTIEWFRGSQAVVYDGIKYVSNQKGTLEILNSQIDDAGQYQCLAKNRGGEDAKNLTVDVHYSPVIISPPVGQDVLMNTTASFLCIATGNPAPQLYWLKDGQRLRSSKQVYVFSNSNGSEIILPRAQPNHAGVYKCHASNSVGHTSAEATLLVLVYPVISSTITQTAFIKGSSAFLPCDTHGIPPPVVHWERNGQRLFIDGHKYISFSNGTLQIKDVQVNDNGIYRCVASNHVGNVTAEITVDIHFFPSVVIEFKNKSVLVDECLVLHCIGSGNPAPVITWRKNTTELLNSSNVYIPPNGTHLTICPVKESDAGIYTCIVTNNLGQSNISANVDVIVPPIVLSHMTSIIVTENKTASLDCFASGNPQPTIEWFKGSQAIVYDGTKYISTKTGILEIMNLHQEGTLKILNSQIDDAGQYQCIATNRGGKIKKNITVDVQCALQRI